MNNTFRVIWSQAKEKWIVVAEKVAAKSCCPSATVGALTVVALLAAGGAAFALDPGALPTGGQITAGSGSIATSGSQMTVNQSSQQMIANWNSFNIGANAGVQFNQPNSAATALNRINDQNPSQILGSLTANGKVFLLNPAGIIFGQSARVDVGGLVASSLNMLDSDFLAGRYNFSNSGSAGSILNQGIINTMPGGVVALIAPKVTNEGSITTPSGSTLLAAGNQVSLDFKGDGLISYTIDQGAVDALADNKGLIKADGGLVVMTAKAANSLTQAVVNNSGVIEAQTLENKSGRILLLADMEHGETIVGGRLDASAPNGGDGGFIETSAAKVSFVPGRKITTLAPYGKTGEWLIDPVDIIISEAGDIRPTDIQDDLAVNNVTISTADPSGIYDGTSYTGDLWWLPSGAGNITVTDTITWSAPTTLSLIANNNIMVNNAITANNGGSLSLSAASGSITQGATGILRISGTTALNAGGNITLNNPDNDFNGAVTIASGNNVILNDTNSLLFGGASTVNGTLSLTAASFIQDAAATITGGAGAPIEIWADTIALNGAANSIRGTGSITLAPISVSRPVVIGAAGGAGDFALDATELSTLKDGFSTIRLGRNGGWNPLTISGSLSFNDPVQIYSNGAGGNITLDASAAINTNGNSLHFSGGTTDAGIFTQTAGATISAGAGTLNIYSDVIRLQGAADSISGTGALTLSPQTTSRAINIGADDAAGVFALNTTKLATLANGFSSITIGGSYTGITTLSGALSFNDRVNIYNYGFGGRITLDASAAVTTNGNNIQFLAGIGDTGAFTQTNGATINAGAGTIRIGADVITLNGAADSISGSSTISFNPFSNGRAINLGANDAAGLFALNAAEILTLKDGFSKIFIGRIDNDTSGLTVSAPLTFNDPLGLILGASAFTVNATPTVAGLLEFTGGNAVNLNASVSATGGVSFGIPVTVGANDLTVDAGTGTATFLSTLAHGGNNFTVTADNVVLGNNWTGTGTRTLQPTTTTQTIGLGTGAGSFSLSAPELGFLNYDTPASVTIGRADGTGAITGSAFTFARPLFLQGGAITQSGAWTLANTLSLKSGSNDIVLTQAGNDFGNTVTIVSGKNVSLIDANAMIFGASTVSGNLTVQTGGALTQSSNLLVTGTTSITAGANDVTLNNALNDFGGAVAVVSGKNITLLDANDMTLSTVTSTGLVDIATKTGDLTLTGTIATNDATVNAIKLNAGKDAAAGTATGGNIIVSGGTVSYGGGGSATLYSGSVAGSAGLSTLVGSGTGRFRYNSDEAVSNYTTALLAGTNAVYREQPTLTVTPGTATITYGDATPAFTATYGAYANGDTSPGTVTGTATWTIGGTTSTGGKLVAGAHEVDYNSGLVSSLGYGFTNNGASSNELTVNKKDLNVSGLTASDKTYDGTTTAALGGTAAVTPVAGDIVNIGGTATGLFADKNAGDTKAITVSGNSISGADSDNYNLIQQSGLTADISKADLSVTASDATKTYGQTPVLTAFTSSGLQNGETIGSVTLASAGTSATAGVAGSPYAITASNATGGTFSTGNYTITYHNGSLTVTPAAADNTTQPTPVQPPLPESQLADSTTNITTVTPPAAAISLTPPALTIGNEGTASSGRTTHEGNAGGTNTGIVGLSNGITIQLVSQPTSNSAGVVTVAVPNVLARPGSSFSFPLPEQVSTVGERGGEVKVSLANGDPLPVWLRYMPESRTFVATDVPAGSMPITAIVAVGSRVWTVEIDKFENL